MQVKFLQLKFCAFAFLKNLLNFSYCLSKVSQERGKINIKNQTREAFFSNSGVSPCPFSPLHLKELLLQDTGGEGRWAVGGEREEITKYATCTSPRARTPHVTRVGPLRDTRARHFVVEKWSHLATVTKRPRGLCGERERERERGGGGRRGGAVVVW